MIREVIKPQDTSLTIDIPKSYIGREVEFIMFPLSEYEAVEKTKQKKKTSLRGVFNQYADNSKISLENSAWQNHIVDKFKQND